MDSEHQIQFSYLWFYWIPTIMLLISSLMSLDKDASDNSKGFALSAIGLILLIYCWNH